MSDTTYPRYWEVEGHILRAATANSTGEIYVHDELLRCWQRLDKSIPALEAILDSPQFNAGICTERAGRLDGLMLFQPSSEAMAAYPRYWLSQATDNLHRAMDQADFGSVFRAGAWAPVPGATEPMVVFMRMDTANYRSIRPHRAVEKILQAWAAILSLPSERSPFLIPILRTPKKDRNAPVDSTERWADPILAYVGREVTMLRHCAAQTQAWIPAEADVRWGELAKSVQAGVLNVIRSLLTPKWNYLPCATYPAVDELYWVMHRTGMVQMLCGGIGEDDAEAWLCRSHKAGSALAWLPMDFPYARPALQGYEAAWCAANLPPDQRQAFDKGWAARQAVLTTVPHTDTENTSTLERRTL